MSLLSQLVLPARVGQFDSPSDIVAVLARRGVLDAPAATALVQLFEITEQMDTGARVPASVVRAAKSSGYAVLKKLSLLGKTAAARFEAHVLSVIEQEIPLRWTMYKDVTVDLGRELLVDSPNAANVAARVDALIVDRSNRQRVIVEVRARIRDTQHVIDLIRWLEHLPEGMPILVIVPNMSDSIRSGLESAMAGSTDWAKLVIWDEEAEGIIQTVRTMIS